jgi:hypothetical protein
LFIVGITAAVAGYYFVVRPARAFMASMTELSEVADLETALTNTSPFAEPADATLSATQVQRFMTVQSAVKTQLGTRFEELKTKYDQIDGELNDGKRTLRLTEAVGAYRDLFALIAEARSAQVSALNAQNFSLDEYRWVRLRVFEAAGLSVSGVDLSELVDRVKQGDFELPSSADVTMDTPGRGVPEQNKTLVAPHAAQLQEWVPFAVFGL